MKLNNEYNFGVVPTVNTPRSRFLMHKNIRTTFNAGELIPIYVNPLIQPGDRIKCKGTVVIRMSTPIYPTMDNLFADIRAFFIPHRLSWNHFKEFMGENTTGAWTQQVEYQVPQVRVYSTSSTGAHKIEKGDILQYMGIPIGYPATATEASATKYKLNALPLRSYYLTWNYWYRDENFVAPLNVRTDDSDDVLTEGSNSQYGKYTTSSTHFLPYKVAPVYKFKDMFNACLPEPQKGDPITLPIGQSAPVEVWGSGDDLNFYNETSGVLSGLYRESGEGVYVNPNIAPYGTNLTVITEDQNKNLQTPLNTSGLMGTADLSQAVAATINAQRMAFAAQRILEASARAGTRYNEIISSIWNVHGIQSAVVQIPQYLGGYRLPIQMGQVLQTSSTDNTSPQGNTAAYSLTVDSQNLFDKGFEEWGTILICVCVRQEHSYSQGIELFWQKKNKLDFYWPQLAYLGEQAIPNQTIFADGSSTDDEIFGYNERWVEYRTEANLNTGMFSPQYAQTLAAWHYGDNYDSLPVLSDEWRRETKTYIDRTLAVTSEVSDQFLMDSRWEFDKTSAIPLRSVPGLLDHF